MKSSGKTADRTEDHIAIAELFNLYADALDAKEWHLLESVFAEDATADFPVDQACLSRKEIISFIKAALATDEIVTHHMFGNLSVSFREDTAEASVRMRAHHAGVGPREGLYEESLGSFSCRFVRTANGWRCCHLREEIYVMLGSPEVFQATSSDQE